MKIIRMCLLVFILALVPFQSAFASGTKTVDSYIAMDIDEHWAYEEMDDLVSADIIDGFMEDEYNMYVKPQENVTRAQFVKIIVGALGLTSDGTGTAFSDVKKDVWYSDSIRIASDLGILEGKGEGKFYPNDLITRAEMTKVIVLAFEQTIDFPETSLVTFSDVNSKYWASEFINKAAGAEIVKGDGSRFNPKGNGTRAEAMVMIHRALQQEQSHLPEDADLTAFLDDHITRENAFAETNAMDELETLYNENGTGYYKAMSLDLFGWIYETEEGEEYSIQIDDENLNLQVLEKSDRFATVEATGMMISAKYSAPDMNFDFTEQMDGVYKLKKDLVSGEWKIYNYFPSFIDEEIISEIAQQQL